MKTKLIFALLAVAFLSCSKIKVSSVEGTKVVNFPDGSSAYLNNGSEIEYNKNFEDREVNQKGEVFYKVTKGDIPFVIKTTTGDVLVLGTEFNVNAVGDKLEVEVERGVVEVKIGEVSRKIRKGEKAIVAGVEKGIEIGKAEFKYKKWTKKIIEEAIKASKEVEGVSKEVDKESRKIGSDINKEFNKLK